MSNADTTTDVVFSKAAGQSYLDFFTDMHAAIKPEWYFEIGTNTGLSLELSKARSIAVDPQFVIKRNVWADKPELHLFQKTSDAFFEEGHLERLGCQIDLAFLDGMHLSDFLLRDFMNAERHMAPGGYIVLHDCLPWTANMALRDRRQVTSRAWTGDVWKVVPVLQEYRPDLTLEVFDAAPSGLVVVSNLDPESRVLSERHDEIVQALRPDSDLGAFLKNIKIKSTANSRWA